MLLSKPRMGARFMAATSSSVRAGHALRSSSSRPDFSWAYIPCKHHIQPSLTRPCKCAQSAELYVDEVVTAVAYQRVQCTQC